MASGSFTVRGLPSFISAAERRATADRAASRVFISLLCAWKVSKEKRRLTRRRPERVNSGRGERRGSQRESQNLRAPRKQRAPRSAERSRESSVGFGTNSTRQRSRARRISESDRRSRSNRTTTTRHGHLRGVAPSKGAANREI